MLFRSEYVNIFSALTGDTIHPVRCDTGDARVQDIVTAGKLFNYPNIFPIKDTKLNYYRPKQAQIRWMLPRLTKEQFAVFSDFLRLLKRNS